MSTAAVEHDNLLIADRNTSTTAFETAQSETLTSKDGVALPKVDASIDETIVNSETPSEQMTTGVQTLVIEVGVRFV